MIVELNITWPAVASPVPTPPHYWSIVAPSAPSTVNCDSYSCSAVVTLVDPRAHVFNTIGVIVILEKQQQQWLAALPRYCEWLEGQENCSWLEGQGIYILETGGRQFLVETQFGLRVIFSLLLFLPVPWWWHAPLSGKVAVGLGFGVVLAGNWLEGNLGKNIFHGENKYEDRQTIPDVDKMSKKENKQIGPVDSNMAKEQKQDSEAKPGDFKGPPKYNESSEGEAKENCTDENPRESQESRNDMEALTIASDCNSFLSSETHSQSPGLPPEDQSSSENIQNTAYNNRCLQIDNLDNQYYSPDHSCDNQQHPFGRTLGQQVARCQLTRSMYNFWNLIHCNHFAGWSCCLGWFETGSDSSLHTSADNPDFPAMDVTNLWTSNKNLQNQFSFFLSILVFFAMFEPLYKAGKSVIQDELGKHQFSAIHVVKHILTGSPEVFWNGNAQSWDPETQE